MKRVVFGDQTQLRNVMREASLAESPNSCSLFDNAIAAIEPFSDVPLLGVHVDEFKSLIGKTWHLKLRHSKKDPYTTLDANRINPSAPVEQELRSSLTISGDISLDQEEGLISLSTNRRARASSLLAILAIEKSIFFQETVGKEASAGPLLTTLNLTDSERNKLNYLQLSNAEIRKMQKRGLPKYFNSLSNAVRKNGMTREEFIGAAYTSGLIPIDRLPEVDWETLDDEDMSMLRFYLDPSDTTTDYEITDVYEVIDHRNKVFGKVGVENFDQLQLVALRDGKIPVEVQ